MPVCIECNLSIFRRRQPYLSHFHFIHTGTTGWGLNENVCEAYLWLKSNYVEGDEIFLFGFSRGGYTARAIGGLIALIGILGKGINFRQVYDRYQKRGSNFGEDEHQSGFRSMQKIKVISVWDTVGSLGAPDQPMDRTYAFHDTTISPCGPLLFPLSPPISLTMTDRCSHRR